MGAFDEDNLCQRVPYIRNYLIAGRYQSGQADQSSPAELKRDPTQPT